MSSMTTAVGPLRSARLAAGMRQVTLARAVGRSQAFISRVENGTLRGRPDFYEAAARVLGCTPRELDPDYGSEKAEDAGE